MSHCSLGADITLQWLIQHSKSRRSWKWSLPSRSSGLSPLMVMGPWQPSLPLPLWSNPALSAHYCLHLHHPVHYHICVAPVQHYRHPNYLESWKSCFSTVLEGGLSIPIMPYCPSLQTCFVSVYIMDFFFKMASVCFEASNEVVVYCSPATLRWSSSNPTLKHPFCCLSTCNVYVTRSWL